MAALKMNGRCAITAALLIIQGDTAYACSDPHRTALALAM